MTYEILWNIKWNLVSLFGATIVNSIIKYIIKKFCYAPTHIKRRTLLSIFDFVNLQVAILAGIVSAITRFGILTGVLFLAVMRIDVYSMPDWIVKLLYLDSFNRAYYATILIQHMHNNPIVITFYELMYINTTKVNSNYSLDQEDKANMNK